MTIKEVNTYNLSVTILNLLKRIIDEEKYSLKKVRLGIQIILINISKTIIIFSIAFFSHLFLETLIVLLSFGFLRQTMGGIHAKTSLRCTIFSTIFLIGTAWGFNEITLSTNSLNILFFISIILSYKYSPADTEINPISDINKVKVLRVESLKRVILLYLFVILIPINEVKCLIVGGLIGAIISILPITHLLLGKKRDNYKKYF